MTSDVGNRCLASGLMRKAHTPNLLTAADNEKKDEHTTTTTI
jgi:hypothetical protein